MKTEIEIRQGKNLGTVLHISLTESRGFQWFKLQSLLDCLQRRQPITSPKSVHACYFSHSKGSLFPLLLNVGWCRDLLWSVECCRRDILGLPNSDLKRHCKFALTLASLQHHMKKPRLSCWRQRTWWENMWRSLEERPGGRESNQGGPTDSQHWAILKL